MVSWIRHYDWLAASADPALRAPLRGLLARQRAISSARRYTGLVSREGVVILKALIFADLFTFLHDGKRYAKSLEQTLGGSRNS